MAEGGGGPGDWAGRGAVPPAIEGLEPLEVVGSGGSGTVWKCAQPRFQRMVAVKLVDTRLNPRAEALFARECSALGELSGHPNIVPVYDGGLDRNGRPYLVMPYISTGSLADRLAQQGPLDWRSATQLMVKVSMALQAAHDAGILHRDIKPENVLMSSYGEPQLADFGVARLAGAPTTMTNTISATPIHAAPEVLNGKTATEASDVYGLASSLYRLLAGTPAFFDAADESLFTLLVRIATQDPAPLTGVPDAVAQAVLRGMAKEPADRTPTARAFADELTAALRTQPADEPVAAERTRRVEPVQAKTPQKPVDPVDLQETYRGDLTAGGSDFVDTTVVRTGEDAHPRRLVAIIAAVLAVVLVAVVVFFLTLYDDPGGGKPAVAAPPPGKKGGQLAVLMAGTVDHLDPQRAYQYSSMNVLRLLTRQLTTYAAQPGAKGSVLVPDLATDLGRPSEDGTSWTFTLREGVAYEDGSPITSHDLKWGIERSMDANLPDGPTYARTYLAGATSYAGPFAGAHLASIETPDARTITFRLAAPHSDFPYVLALPAFSPVPQRLDNRTHYDQRPFSSGPYKVDAYVPGTSLTLSRNASWSHDDVRRALPDTVVVTMGLDPADIDKRLRASAGADARAVSLDSPVAPADLPAVLTGPAKDRAVSGRLDYVRFVIINTSRGPLRDLRVRQALQYATNRRAAQTARGGSDSADPATTMLSPTLAGHRDFDAYPAGDTGDATKGRQLLAAAGYPRGFTATMWVVDNPTAVAYGAAFRAAMRTIGVTVTVLPKPVSTYYTDISSPAKEPDLLVLTWLPDWPTGSAVIGQQLDSRLITADSNQNYAQLRAPDVDAQIDRINAMTDIGAAAKAWGALDETILKEQAPMIPLVVEKQAYLRGTEVTGAYLSSFYQGPDLISLGVA